MKWWNFVSFLYISIFNNNSIFQLYYNLSFLIWILLLIILLLDTLFCICKKIKSPYILWILKMFEQLRSYVLIFFPSNFHLLRIFLKIMFCFQAISISYFRFHKSIIKSIYCHKFFRTIKKKKIIYSIIFFFERGWW